MQIKEIFTIPDEQKATEKAFCRVLISTICWTVLCMICLAGTTWAWFTASVESKENVIEIASATAYVSVNGQEISQAYQTDSEGEFDICVRLEHSENDWKVPVYVLMYVTQQENSSCYYFTFTSGGQMEQNLRLPIAELTNVSFQVSWIAPAEAKPVEELAQTIEELEETESTQESTETTDPTGESISAEETSASENTTEPEPEETETSAPTEESISPEESS